jgi:hypothetical protein
MAMICAFTLQRYCFFCKKLTFLGEKCTFFVFFSENVSMFEKKLVSLQAETCVQSCAHGEIEDRMDITNQQNI